MNPKSTDIFGRLSWLTKSFKNLCCRLGILEQTVAECCEGGGGGGGTNPTSTYIPYNNAGTFADSYLVNNTTSSVLKSVYGGNDVGIKCDFINFEYSLGDPNALLGSNTGISMYATPGASTAAINCDGTTYFSAEKTSSTNFCYIGTDSSNFYFTEGSSIGLFNNSIYNGFEIIYNASLSDITDVKIGDYTNTTTGTSIITDVTNSIIKTQYGGIDIGLNLDFNYRQAFLGDWANTNNGVSLLVDDNNSRISTLSGGSAQGLKLDMGSEYLFGDITALSPTNTYLRAETGKIETIYNTLSTGLRVDFTNNIYELGNLSVPATRLSVDDAAQKVSVYSANGLDVQQSYVTNVYNDFINLSLIGYAMPSPGNYIIGNVTPGNTLDFPDPNQFPGAEIFIVIDDSNNCDIGGPYTVRTVTQGSSNTLTQLAGKNTYIFKSINSVWLGGSLF